jgi:hypothetical protein
VSLRQQVTLTLPATRRPRHRQQTPNAQALGPVGTAPAPG